MEGNNKMKKITLLVLGIFVAVTINATASQLDVKVEKYLDNKIVMAKKIKSAKKRLEEKIIIMKYLCDEQKMPTREKNNVIETIKSFNTGLENKDSEYRDYVFYTKDLELLWNFIVHVELYGLTHKSQIDQFLNSDFLNIENSEQAGVQIHHFQRMYKENGNTIFKVAVAIPITNQMLKFEIDKDKKEIIVSLNSGY